MINLINPKSVIDIGCGTGTWADVFKKRVSKKLSVLMVIMWIEKNCT